jgi:5-methylcytosine-specific restriction endonuclease McrA
MTPAERSAKFKAAHPERAAIYNARYYAAHKDRVKAANEKWRAENPDKVRDQQRRWRKANVEKAREKGRRWYAAHPDYYANRRPAYAAANRALLTEIEGRRRARKYANGVFVISPRDWRRMLARYRDVCAYCGMRAKLDMDHVIPLARGGRHSIGNVLPACDACNGGKGTKFLAEWRYRH